MGIPIHRSYRYLPLLFLLLTAISAGCGSRSVDTEEGEPRVLEVEVVVDNRNWQNVTIYVLRGGGRVRLGIVTSMNTGTFLITAEMTGAAQIRLLADPVGSTQTFSSQPLRVEPGDVIEWRLAANLLHSAIFVR